MTPDRPAEVDWDARLAGEGYLLGTAQNAFLVSCCARVPGSGRVLCVADGEGRNSVLAGCPGARGGGLRASPVRVAEAARLARARGVAVEYHVADADGRDWPREAFDVVARRPDATAEATPP